MFFPLNRNYEKIKIRHSFSYLWVRIWLAVKPTVSFFLPCYIHYVGIQGTLLTNFCVKPYVLLTSPSLSSFLSQQKLWNIYRGLISNLSNLWFLQIIVVLVSRTGFRCSLPMEIGVKMSDFEASKKRNATTGKVKYIFLIKKYRPGQIY